MKLENTFRIPVPAAEAWPVLLDLERIAPCVPGATLTSRDGDDFHGKIKVKLGPVGLTYNGIIKVASQDPKARIAVLEGGGREARGNGTAQATIICRLVESGYSTEVLVETELAITGKPAQFGRGALADVAGTLIGQFATNLASEITSTAQSAAPAVDPKPVAAAGARPEKRAVPRASAEPIDLLAAAGVGRSGRALAVAAGIVLALALILRRRRRSRG
ncbi:SRPBCC family protein [Nocardia sp. NPDC050712]|uniref:SRPBCC family protein n=1 Tax=Nocardia sp. NPDC050712 TaxID=3155518 RepID=UPI0033F3984F